MHPALSIIVFTTLAGAGYGLLFWIAVFALAAPFLVTPTLGIAATGLGLAVVTLALLTSTAHLGHPERAWRALSQWRSSWLSREGVAALLTYIPAALLAASWLFPAGLGFLREAAAAGSSIGAAATVACTAYIYRSLKPIRAWDNGWVLPNYLAFAGMTGALWLVAIAALVGAPSALAAFIGVATIAIAAACKISYWNHIDRARPTSTAGSATGLGNLGAVRLFEAPHTSENYLLKEMGFRIARKHAAKLRAIAAILAFALPLALTIVDLLANSWLKAAAAILAALLGTVGVAVERWLFFAEAKHTVTLYYGERTDEIVRART